MIVGAGKFEIHRAGGRLETRGLEVAVVRQNSFFEKSVFAPEAFN